MNDSDKVFYTSGQVKMMQAEIDALRAQVEELEKELNSVIIKESVRRGTQAD